MKIPDGKYMIINTTSNFALSMRDTSVTLETKDESSACQKWHFTQGTPNEYSIKNIDTKNFLGVQGRIQDGALVEGISARMQWLEVSSQSTADYWFWPAGIAFPLTAPDAPRPGVSVFLRLCESPLAHWVLKSPDDD